MDAAIDSITLRALLSRGGHVIIGWYIVLAILKQGLEEVAEAKRSIGAAA